jgi:hypothetical protein
MHSASGRRVVLITGSRSVCKLLLAVLLAPEPGWLRGKQHALAHIGKHRCTTGKRRSHHADRNLALHCDGHV